MQSVRALNVTPSSSNSHFQLLKLWINQGVVQYLVLPHIIKAVAWLVRGESHDSRPSNWGDEGRAFRPEIELSYNMRVLVHAPRQRAQAKSRSFAKLPVEPRCPSCACRLRVTHGSDSVGSRNRLTTLQTGASLARYHQLVSANLGPAKRATQKR